MKGIVFTEFMKMVEETWDIDLVDDLIAAVQPKSGGAYTTVASYDHEELVSYVVELSKIKGIGVDKLVFTFGHYLSKVFSSKFPQFFEEANDLFSFLKKIDNHIHVEVRKLYPDAELPKFTYKEVDENTMHLYYKSSRNFSDLAHGLIMGSAEYFGEKINITRNTDVDSNLADEEFIVERV